MLGAAEAPARSTMGGRTPTVGLPLSRAGEDRDIWDREMAVFLGYLMATDGDEDGADPSDPAPP